MIEENMLEEIILLFCPICDKFGDENCCKNMCKICGKEGICARYNYSGEFFGKRCKKHKEDDMIWLDTKEECEIRFRKNIEKQRGKVVGEYKGANTPVECECKKGHKCKPRPNDIQQGHGMCRVCAGNCPIEAEKNFRKNVEKQGGKVKGGYVNNNTPVVCECKKGHKCSPAPTSIQQGGGMCGQCSSSISKGEQLLEKISVKLLEQCIIEDNTFQYRHEMIPTLRYDRFWIYKNQPWVIEYHGGQHEKYTPYFHKTEEDFYLSRQRDWLKVEIARIDNMKLLILPHFVSKYSEEELSEYILKHMDECGDNCIVCPWEDHEWVNNTEITEESIRTWVDEKYQKGILEYFGY